jgi:hypothetical protein
MNKINQNIVNYLSYLKQTNFLDAKYDLDHIESKLLDEVAISMTSGKLLSVSKLLAIKSIASPATIHAAMKRLILKKMLIQISSKDSRIKYLELSALGLKRYSELSELTYVGSDN